MWQRTHANRVRSASEQFSSPNGYVHAEFICNDLQEGMNNRRLLVGASVLLATLTPALAQPDAQSGSTLDHMLPQIRSQHAGQLSDAEVWVDGNGHKHYRIKWLTPDGRVVVIDEDATSDSFRQSGP